MACCDEEEVLTAGSRYHYVGPSSGAYEQVTELKYVGEGQGSISKEQVKETKPGVPWVWCACLAPLLILPFLPFFFINPASFENEVQVGAAPVITTTSSPRQIIIRHHVIHRNRVVHVPVPMPGAPHVVYDKVQSPHMSYSCYDAETSAGKLWSPKHKAWCCWKQNIACPTHVVTHDKYIHVTHTHAVPVPKYYKVRIPAEAPKPIYEKVPIPTDPLPPKKVMVPVKVPGKRPPPIVHYKYLPVEKHYDVPHTVYDKKKVEVPVIVKRYVKEEVPETPEVVTKTEHVYVHEKGYDCVEGFHNYQELWTEDQKRFCCWKHDRGCPSTHYKTKTEVKTRVKYVDVPVPSPPKIIERDHEEHMTSFNCNEGFSNWYHGWSPLKKKYCCAHEDRGCPGSKHGHWEMHGHASVHVEGGGKAKGKIYDCGAGFSDWLQGWSDSKKTWCCDHESRGCVKHHCFTGTISDWNKDKRDWCCRTHQRGCAHTTLSPLGCDAVCELHGESSTCHDRIHWVRDNVFGSRENNCALAYSKVQVDCDVCRACTIQAMGCEVAGGGGGPAFDCNAALGNFARAWSPPKKQWCCSNQGKGCEGSSPPTVDPGFGMQWKHVQVSGAWTWVAVHVAGLEGRCRPSCPMIAALAWPTGSWAGPTRRKAGAAPINTSIAPLVELLVELLVLRVLLEVALGLIPSPSPPALDTHPPLRRRGWCGNGRQTIGFRYITLARCPLPAMQVSPIGSRAGLAPRRIGVAKTKGLAASEGRTWQDSRWLSGWQDYPCFVVFLQS